VAPFRPAILRFRACPTLRSVKVQELVTRYIISMKGYTAREKMSDAIAGTES